jgi:uncharacterized protein YqeY
MTLHQTIKEQITEALRAKDTIRLDTLRGLNALILNEIIAGKVGGDTMPDDKVLVIIKRSAKQRKDSIQQFRLGKREDLAVKEEAELKILEAFLPQLMPPEEVKGVVKMHIDKLKSESTFDPKAAGKITGMIMKQLAGKADGADVKAAVEELIK